MPYNGSGVFSVSGSPFQPGTTIESTPVNDKLADLASGLSSAVTRDGQSPASANLPMAGFRHTGVGTATARNQYASLGQVQDGGAIWCGTAGGSANARTLAPNPSIPAYAEGQFFRFVVPAAGANTGATTLAVSGLTATAIRKGDGTTALAAGDLPAGALVVVGYDGTVFRLVSVTYTSAQFRATLALGSAALLNATTVGSALVQAADATAARNAIGVGPAQDLGFNSVSFGDANFYLSLLGGVNPHGVWDTGGDYWVYDRASNAYTVLIGNTARMTVSATGTVSIPGTLTANDATITSALTVNGVAITGNGVLVDRAYAEYTTNTNLTAQIPADDTVPLSTEGTQILSVTITPKTSTNRLRVRFQAYGGASTNAVNAVWAFFAGTTCIAAGATRLDVAAANTLAGEVEYVPGSTSAVTISVRVGPGAAETIRLNGSAARLFGGTSRATLVVDEIAA